MRPIERQAADKPSEKRTAFWSHGCLENLTGAPGI